MTQRRSHVKKAPHPSKLPAKDSTTTAACARLSALEHLSTTACKEYGKSERTRTSYARYVQQGKVFLDEHASDEHAAGGGGDTANRVELELWKEAFDNPPNKCSADALKLFLTWKCFENENGRSTAEVIQAAFADFWDNM
jgi:hypothetical protein